MINKSKMPLWTLEHKKKGTQITKIKDKYYLYKVKSIWDKDAKKSKKITEEYLGRITPEGIVTPKHKRELKIECPKEYGNISFVNSFGEDLIKKLKHYFPYDYESIICVAIIKLCYQSRINNMSLRYKTSHLSKIYENANMSPKKISELLNTLGNDDHIIKKFFEDLKEESETIAIDLTSIFTDSENISFAEKGHNSKKIYHDQLQFLMLYSLTQNLPTFFKVLPGSVRDVSSLVNAIEESGYSDAILVSDRGFTSENNWKFLEGKSLKYIFPLRRNSALLSYNTSKHKDYFMFRERVIWYREFEKKSRRIIQFLDKKLLAEEEKTYICLKEKKIVTKKEYEKKKGGFGIISIITNTDKTPKDIFEIYKSRNDIEIAFDIMKNCLNDDKTYMQSTENVKGYFFITFLSLYLYIKIQNLLKEKKMLKKYSVTNTLLHLSKFYKFNVNDKEIISEIPKQTRLIMEKLGIPIT